MLARLHGPLLDAALVGTPRRLGVIVATTTHANNGTTAVPFNASGDGLAGKLLLIQPDAACYIAVGETNSAEATTTDVRLEANERVLLNMGKTDKFLATEAVTGTVNLQVYEMR